MKEVIAEALRYLDAGCSRSEWVRVLMAIKAELGDGGFYLAESWSKTAPEKFNSKNFRDTWKSIKPCGGITVGTLIFDAQKHGFSLSGGIRGPIDHEAIEQRRRVFHLAEEVERRRTAERQQISAEYAEDLFSNADLANPNHPYLKAKMVLAHDLRQYGSDLLVPMYFDGKLANLQRIGPNIGRKDNKRFLQGGRVTGCYGLLGPILANQRLHACEGWATGATLYEDKGHSVACTMTAGNLMEVCRRLILRYPGLPLTIAGDDDRQKKGNPGRTAAENAATALGCSLIFPPWPADAPLHLSDFNDLHQWLKGR